MGTAAVASDSKSQMRFLLGMQEAKVMDQTRGILTYVEQNCPGRFHSSIEYVTVAGKYIQGAWLRDKGASIPQKIVGAGYQQVSTHHASILAKFAYLHAESWTCSTYRNGTGKPG